MLAQPNDSCPATGSASSFVGNVQDPVPFDNNDTHAILEPMQDSFQHDNNNEDNEGDKMDQYSFRIMGNICSIFPTLILMVPAFNPGTIAATPS